MFRAVARKRRGAGGGGRGGGGTGEGGLAATPSPDRIEQQGCEGGDSWACRGGGGGGGGRVLGSEFSAART